MGLKVLLVDDSETVRAVMAKTFDLAGLDIEAVHHAANGKEALAVLRQESVDLVFTDINMPVMGGVEMLETMKQDSALANIPVVIVSTEGSATRVDQLKEKGVSAYVRKPFTPEGLREVIDSIIGDSNGS